MRLLPHRLGRRGAVTLLVAGVALGWFLADRPAESFGLDDALVFAMAVKSEDGRVLASPVVVGGAGQKVQVRLVCDSDPRRERMSLTLDPIDDGSGELHYSYELSVPGRVRKARGIVSLQPGSERRISVAGDQAEALTLDLYAAPIDAPGVERYLKARRTRLDRAAT